MPLTPGLAAAAAVAVTSPYLAALTVRVPDRADSAWWRGRRVQSGRIVTCALVGAIFGLLAGVAAGATAAWPAFAVLAVILTPLTVIDIEHHRLPDRLVLAALVAGAVLLTTAAAVRQDWAALLRAAVAAVACFAAFFLLALLAPRSLGFGDVKLAGLLGGYLGWLGWGSVLPGLFLGFVIGGVVAVVALVGGRASLKTQLPFGPPLILGALLAGALYTGF